MDTLIRRLPVPPHLSARASKRRQASNYSRGYRRSATDCSRARLHGQQVRSAGPYPLLRWGRPSKVWRPTTRTLSDSIPSYVKCFRAYRTSKFLRCSRASTLTRFPLNAQELRNGKYFGYFKQTCYRLAHEHVEFWRRQHIFGDRGIARMQEVELTSELVVAQIAGLQDKKTSLNRFYANFDEEFLGQRSVETRFRANIDAIEEGVGSLLQSRPSAGSLSSIRSSLPSIIGNLDYRASILRRLRSC